ncbi:MAG: hypothetical protein J7480_04345 [Microbacteriaceae bacterium]|nr:hypothetical protein [Microbacteriaceae bacterium]
MTTDVHERIVPQTVAPQRPRGLRAWITFLVTVLLAAVVIGIIAALLGKAAQDLEDATNAAIEAQAAVSAAHDEAVSAQAAEDAAQAAIDAKRQAIIDEINAQPHEPGFSISTSSPAFAEVRAMEDALEQHEHAAVEAARQAETAAEAAVPIATAQVTAARTALDGLVAPFWIALTAGIALVGLVLWAAIARTRRDRRRRARLAR